MAAAAADAVIILVIVGVVLYVMCCAHSKAASPNDAAQLVQTHRHQSLPSFWSNECAGSENDGPNSLI